MRHRFAGILAAAALAVASSALAAGSLTVSSASLKGDTLTMDLNASADGWVVIHEVKNGSAGEHIGHAQLKSGDNKNVQVKLDGTVTPGEEFIVMLHEDTGEKGKFEFMAGSNADKPVMEAGKPVMTKLAPK